MLVKVSSVELAVALSAEQPLPFDLYEANGTVLHGAGQCLSSKDLKMLNKRKVYRHWKALPLEQADPLDQVDHEGILLQFPNTTLREADWEQLHREEAEPTIYQPDTAHLVFQAITTFWTKMAEGEAPDIALGCLIRDQLISEVTDRINQVRFIAQLRVRDGFTYSHTLHVAALSIALATKLGLSKKEIQEIGLAAILHDLGKLYIPKSIMFKPTRLTEKEFEVMKLHPGLGYQAIRQELKLPDHIARPALEHQEMWGGGGYPFNLRGEEMHLYSQIVKIADVYDALTAKRPYKDPIPSQKAIQIMSSEGEKSFNPAFLAEFMNLANYVPAPDSIQK